MEHRTYESVKYTFTADEIRGLGESLAHENQTVFDLREQKKALTADVSARVKHAEGRVADLTNRVNNGYEMREVECLVLFEDPRPGLKTIVRMDTNEKLKVESMTLAEMQGSFGFKEPEAGAGE